MNQITNPPNTYGFGLDFNYSVWPKNTEVTLCNVNWNNDYADVVDSPSKVNAYINSQKSAPKIVTQNVSYLKYGKPVRLDIPFNTANRFNYMRVSNPLQPVAGDQVRDYFYFVQDVSYVAPNTTEFIIQLDVWATYRDRVTFRQAYVERSHIAIANTNQNNNYGRSYLNVPEPLDIGNEPVTIWEHDEPIMARTSNLYPTGRTHGTWWLVVSAVNLHADPGTIGDPNLDTAYGSLVNGIPSGTTSYVMSADTLSTLFSHLSSKPWYSQAILRVQAIPNPERYGGELLQVYQPDPWTAIADLPIYGIQSSGSINYNLMPKWRNNPTFTPHILDRHRHLRKFLTSPFLWIELSSQSGPKITLRPENWWDENARISEVASYNAMNPRIAAIPHSYNATSHSGGETVPNIGYVGGDALDRSLILSNLPTTAVVNDQGTLLQAQNAHSIAAQRNAVGWQQNRALTGAQADMDNANASIQATSESNLWNQARLDNIRQYTTGGPTQQGAMEASRVSQAVSSGVGAAMSGPAGIGQLPGIINASQQNLIQQELFNNLNRQEGNTAALNTGTQTGYMGSVRDTNKTYADMAARGDYSASIASIDGKVQDMELSPPSVSGNMGGDSLLLEQHYIGYRIQLKAIDHNAMVRVGDYWLRYGYSINQFIDLNNRLSVMSKFTYWKTKETYVTTSGVPEAIRQALRGIMEKGVTVWQNPEDVGTSGLTGNAALAGVSY